MSKFGVKSEQRLLDANLVFQLLCRRVLERSVIDFGITRSYSTPEEQYKLFLSGVSKLDGYENKSNHNFNPSNAIDFVAYVGTNITWESKYYYYIAGLFESCAKEIGVEIRWGGNFDMDNDIGEQSFNDLCHIEIIDNRYKTKE